MRCLALATLLSVTVACDDSRSLRLGEPRDAGLIADGGDADAAVDGGVGQSDGAVDSGSSNEEIACPSSSGFDRVGRTWRYRSTPEYEAQSDARHTQSLRITSIDDFGDHLEVELAMEIEISGTVPQGGFTLSTRGTFLYRCDGAGLSLVETHTTSDFVFPGGTSADIDDKAYSPPLLVIPQVITAGTRWDARSEVTHTSEADGEVRNSTFEVVETRAAGEQVSLTTPAGRFDAWAVTTTHDDGEASIGYWVDGVGRVADELDGVVVADLVAWE